MSFAWYVEDLDYVAKVTKMLNEQMPQIAAFDDSRSSNKYSTYIHVELRERDTAKKVGEWSDEIASDCWSFTETWDRDE